MVKRRKQVNYRMLKLTENDYMHVHACVWVCVCACVWVRACVRAFVCVCVKLFSNHF